MTRHSRLEIKHEKIAKRIQRRAQDFFAMQQKIKEKQETPLVFVNEPPTRPRVVVKNINAPIGFPWWPFKRDRACVAIGGRDLTIYNFVDGYAVFKRDRLTASRARRFKASTWFAEECTMCGRLKGRRFIFYYPVYEEKECYYACHCLPCMAKRHRLNNAYHEYHNINRLIGEMKRTANEQRNKNGQHDW